MRFSRCRSLLAATAVALATACHDDGPTAPTAPPPDAPDPHPLAGQWHGTASYPNGPCRAEPVVASVGGQRGTQVGISIQTACLGFVRFFLNFASPALTGTAKIVVPGPCQSIFGPVNNFPLDADASGTASETHMHVETQGFSSRVTSCSRPAVTFELDR